MSRFVPVLLTDARPADAGSLPEAAMAAVLNGALELWHPALLPHWSEAPRLAPPSEHAEPLAGRFYVLPEDPPPSLSGDWRQRAAAADSRVASGLAFREKTREHLFAAMALPPAPEPPPAFFGLGFGCLLLEQLSEAMGHGNPLDIAAFWETLQQAAAAAGEERIAKLKSGADLLRAARDVLYPSTLHLLDLALLDEWPPGEPPWALRLSTPLNAIASGAGLRRWAAERPHDFALLKKALDERTAEICGGHEEERPDALLPIEDQFGNLHDGRKTCRTLLGHEPPIAARARFGATPLWPELATSIGQRHAVLLSFDGASVPTYKGAVLEWPNPAGKSLLAFVRAPERTEGAATWFAMATRLHETIMGDFSALFVHLSRGSEPTWQRDWLALHQLAPVFGQPMLFSAYFGETYASEHPPSLPADDFRSVRLEDRCRALNPISSFAESARRQRQAQAAAAAWGMLRGLSAPASAPLDPNREGGTARLAERLLRRAAGETPGHLVVNPCSFTRRVVVDLPNVTTPLPAPAKATQLHAGGALASVELPPFGFAWLPLAVASGTKIAQPRHPIAEKNRLRNEFLEAEIDEQTGGLRELRDVARKIGRLGVQLVHSAGSRMRMTELKLESAGPALGKATTRGELAAENGDRLAGFTLAYELGWGVPLLKVRVELDIAAPPSGSPWNDCFALRLAWPDPQALLSRSLGWSRAETKAEQFEASEFIEIASGSLRTTLLTGGLPFARRRGARMADLILVAPGEEARVFEVAFTVDQAAPLLAAEDWLAPPLVVPTAKGPPPGGPTAWLFDLDSAHVFVSSLRAAEEGDAVVARLVECQGVSGEAQLRCPRHPVRAETLDERGEILSSLTTVDDTVFLHFAPFEATLVRLVFSA